MSVVNELDKLDLKILNLLQESFPLSDRPYEILAKKLEISEETLLQRLALLKENKTIRRIGGIMDSKEMGFYSILCAASVALSQLDEFAQIINTFSGVTHNYIRQDELNIWFTFTAASKDEVMAVLSEIEKKTAVKIYTFPARKVYKIKVSFEMENKNEI